MINGGYLYNHLDGPEDSPNNVAIPVHGTDMDTCFGHPDTQCR